jgi:hypothetical protein
MINSQLDDDLFDESPSHEEDNEIFLSNEVELNILANVKYQFNIGEFFSQIETNLALNATTCQSFQKHMDGNYFTTTYLSLT